MSEQATESGVEAPYKSPHTEAVVEAAVREIDGRWKRAVDLFRRMSATKPIQENATAAAPSEPGSHQAT